MPYRGQYFHSAILVTTVIILTMTEMPCNVESKKAKSTNVLNMISKSNARFTWDIYQQMKAATCKNIFFSPYSILNALGMLAMGTGSGVARNQLKRALRLDPALPNNALDRGIQIENRRLRSKSKLKKLQLLVANKLYVEKGDGYSPNPQYLKNITRYYGGSMAAVNFKTDKGETVRLINDWISKQTRGMIKSLVPNKLDPQTQMILANAIFFNGSWRSAFDPRNTRKGRFHVPKSSKNPNGGRRVQVPMMTQTEKLLFATDKKLGVETVILPYKGKPRLAMHIILPIHGRTLSQLESKGSPLNVELLQHLASQARKRLVRFSMPKFKLKQVLELSNLMKKLKVTDIFHPTKNAISKVFQKLRSGFFVNEILHEAKVEVDERGTVAAAATAIIQTRSGPVGYLFEVNRPFIFYVADESNGFILFWGRVCNPAKIL